MQKIQRPLSIAAWSLVLSLVLSHCGGSGQDTLTSSFFPLNVGDVRNLTRTTASGATAKFTQTVEAATTVNGTSVFPFTTRDANGNVTRVDYYGTDNSNGVAIIGFDDNENGISSRYNPPVLLPILMPGLSHSDTVQVVGGGNFASVTSLAYRDTFIGFEDCTVPAGSFSNCAHLTIEVNNQDASGNVVEDGIFTYFLVPTFGPIRMDHTGLSMGSASSVVDSAVIGGNSIP